MQLVGPRLLFSVHTNLYMKYNIRVAPCCEASETGDSTTLSNCLLKPSADRRYVMKKTKGVEQV